MTDTSGEIHCQGLSCDGTELSEITFNAGSGILEISFNVLWRGYASFKEMKWLIVGVRGHRFHVFNEPYYYAEPEIEFQHR
jgi:hypothetical protein